MVSPARGRPGRRRRPERARRSPRRVARFDPATPPLGRRPASPCGNRATNRRLRAPRIANTMKNVSVLSIGSDSSPCFRTAVPRSSPACWNAATRKSVPRAGHAAEDDGGDRRGDDRRHDPADSPATKTYAAPRSRLTNSSASRPDRATPIEDQRDEPAEDHEDRLGPGGALRGRSEERDCAVAVERDEPVDRRSRRRSRRRRPPRSRADAAACSGGSGRSRAGRRCRRAARSRPRR